MCAASREVEKVHCHRYLIFASVRMRIVEQRAWATLVHKLQKALLNQMFV
jgi:hypothetical protein